MVAAYHAAVGYPVVRLLVVDDARQFKTTDGRAGTVLGMRAAISVTGAALCAASADGWRISSNDLGTTTGSCWFTARGQVSREAERLPVLDQLFSSVTGYTALDERIAQTQAKKAHLLMKVDASRDSLHNNPAELGARTRVRKRDVQFRPANVTGAQCWDTFKPCTAAAKKLGVNFYEYICERVRGGASQLPELIASKALEVPLGASWDPAPDY